MKYFRSCLLFICSVFILCSCSNKSSQTMGGIVEKELIYDNIYIGSYHMGGLSKEKAIQFLQKELQKVIREKKVTVHSKSKIYEYLFSDFSLGYDVEASVNEAFMVGRKAIDANDVTAELSKEAVYIQVYPMFASENLSTLMKDLFEEQHKEAVNASYKRENEKFIFIPEEKGEVIDQDVLSKDLRFAFASLEDSTISIVKTKELPKYGLDDLKKSTDLLASFHTKSASKTGGRYDNLKLGASRINGTVLYPGEIFSTNERLKPRTVQNGYKNAPVIENGEFVDGVGGGICQISTTLYNTVLLAELKIVERQNHSLPIAYVPLGRDATISGNSIDFKFQNDTKYPIYIEYTLVSNQLTASIYGHKETTLERTIEFKSEIRYIDPPPDIETLDESLGNGERIVDQKAKSGAKVSLYKYVYINGNETEKILINQSSYRPRPARIRYNHQEMGMISGGIKHSEFTNPESEQVSQETEESLAIVTESTEEEIHSTEMELPETENETKDANDEDIIVESDTLFSSEDPSSSTDNEP